MRVLVAVAAISIVSSATAQDWPRFRGANGSGISATAIPTRWTDKDYRWQAKLPGSGHSSPVLWGERLFVTSSDGKGNLHVTCLDAKTGREYWNREFAAGSPRGHKDNNLASATPALDAKNVYLAWSSPKNVVLVALTHDGKDVWRREFASFGGGHGFGSSPMVHDGIVILPCEENGKDSLVAVEAETGKDRWRVARKSRNTYATPIVFLRPDLSAELIAVSYEDGVTSLDPKTGKLIWDADIFDKRHVEGAIASPIAHGDTIFATAAWLNVRYETIAIRPGAKSKFETAFKVDRDAPLVPTPVAKGDLLFLWSDRGIVSCVDAKTGANHWRERVEGSFYASPVVAGQHVYCPSREGNMVVLKVSKQFEQVASIPLGEGTHATPAIAGGRMFIRTLSRVSCLEPP
jgi:outer membrane protein assembly factor BamB